MALAAVASLSLGVLKGWNIFGLTIFDSLDYLTANILLPAGGFFTCIFVGWRLDRKILKAEISNNGTLKFRIYGVFIFLVRYVCPAALLLIFLITWASFSGPHRSERNPKPTETMKRFIVLLLVCCLGAAVTARPIRGTVKCAGTPVSGVTVTDGHSFTESGADGTFTLDADDDALFISIVTPSGYLAPMEQDIPQFFRPYAASTKRYDFELRPWPATGEVYELLAIGDPQPKTAAHFDRLRTEIIPELQRATALGKQRGTAQAALLLGDIVWGLSGAVRRRPRAVLIARNTGLRRDRQPRPRPGTNTPTGRPRRTTGTIFRTHHLPYRPYVRTTDRTDRTTYYRTDRTYVLPYRTGTERTKRTNDDDVRRTVVRTYVRTVRGRRTGRPDRPPAVPPVRPSS